MAHTPSRPPYGALHRHATPSRPPLRGATAPCASLRTLRRVEAVREAVACASRAREAIHTDARRERTLMTERAVHLPPARRRQAALVEGFRRGVGALTVELGKDVAELMRPRVGLLDA